MRNCRWWSPWCRWPCCASAESRIPLGLPTCRLRAANRNGKSIGRHGSGESQRLSGTRVSSAVEPAPAPTRARGTSWEKFITVTGKQRPKVHWSLRVVSSLGNSHHDGWENIRSGPTRASCPLSFVLFFSVRVFFFPRQSVTQPASGAGVRIYILGSGQSVSHGRRVRWKEPSPSNDYLLSRLLTPRQRCVLVTRRSLGHWVVAGV